MTCRRKHKGGGTIPRRGSELQTPFRYFWNGSHGRSHSCRTSRVRNDEYSVEAAIGSGKNTPEYVLMSRLGLLAECFDAEGKLCDHSRRDNSTHEKSLFERERRVQRFAEDWRKVFVSAVERSTSHEVGTSSGLSGQIKYKRHISKYPFLPE